MVSNPYLTRLGKSCPSSAQNRCRRQPDCCNSQIGISEQRTTHHWQAAGCQREGVCIALLVLKITRCILIRLVKSLFSFDSPMPPEWGSFAFWSRLSRS